MPAVTRKGDMNTGHEDYPSVALNRGSNNVFVNGIPCGRQTDTYNSHSDSEGNHNHSGYISGGSSSVFVNGFPIARVGDSVSCGGSVLEGSPNVFAN